MVVTVLSMNVMSSYWFDESPVANAFSTLGARPLRVHGDCLCAGIPTRASNRFEDTLVEYIHEFDDSLIEEPISQTWILLDRVVLVLGSSTPRRRANSGHWRSAALWVKNTVGSPSVSTIATRRLFCLNQNWRVPLRLAPKWSTLLEKASLPTISISSLTVRWASWRFWRTHVLPVKLDASSQCLKQNI